MLQIIYGNVSTTGKDHLAIKGIQMVSMVNWTSQGERVYKRRRPNVVLMLGHRRRRWPNFKTTLGQYFVFDGVLYGSSTRSDNTASSA